MIDLPDMSVSNFNLKQRVNGPYSSNKQIKSFFGKRIGIKAGWVIVAINSKEGNYYE